MAPESRPSRHSARRRIGLVLAGLTLALTTLGLCCVSFGPPSTSRAFAGRPRPSEHVYASANGVRVATAETGPEGGPLVLFVHGTPGGWQAFSFVMADARLGERARLISVDRPGWGRSSACGLVSSLAEQAAALRAVLEAHAVNGPAVVVGHSLGGPIAARLAMEAPELVRALVLVAPALDPELEEPTWYQALGRIWPIRALVPDGLARADEELRPLKRELTAMLPRWATLRLPVCVLQGEDDALVPAANADFVQRMAMHATLTIERIPEQGHFIPWERPELVTAAVLRALGER